MDAVHLSRVVSQSRRYHAGSSSDGSLTGWVHTNGLGLLFLSRMNSSIAAPNFGTLLKTPRRMRVRSPNHRSTRFSHEALVGVTYS